MNIMAAKTGHLVYRMIPGIPIMQVECGICSVTFKADERLGRGWKIL